MTILLSGHAIRWHFGQSRLSSTDVQLGKGQGERAIGQERRVEEIHLLQRISFDWVILKTG